MTIIPFRRPAAKEPPKPERCPDCGWAIPYEVEVYTSTGEAVDRLVLHLRCPECSSPLLWVVRFES